MKQMFIIRGVPGSGKTTLAEEMARNFPDSEIVCADDYFMVHGEYRFNPKELKQAHEFCRCEVEQFAKEGYENIFVHNTFTREWEMQPYFEIAEKYGYMVHSIIVENRHGGKNQHGVPEESINRMKKRFEVEL